MLEQTSGYLPSVSNHTTRKLLDFPHPQKCSSFLLTTLSSISEDTCDEPSGGLILTVPSHQDDLSQSDVCSHYESYQKITKSQCQ